MDVFQILNFRIHNVVSSIVFCGPSGTAAKRSARQQLSPDLQEGKEQLSASKQKNVSQHLVNPVH